MWAAKSTVRFWLGVAGLALIGGIIILLCTLSGIGVQPDSLNFILASNTLRAGQGFLKYSDEFIGYHVFQPFLYPTILALVRTVTDALGFDFLSSLRVFNALLFATTILASAYLFTLYLRSKFLAFLGTLAVVVSLPFLVIFSQVYTEPIFALLGVLFLICLPKFLSGQKVRWFIALCILAALASVDRYIGVIFIATGAVCILLLMPQVRWQRRFVYAAAFCVIAILPLALWLTRNYMLTGAFTGDRPLATRSVIVHIGYTIYWLMTWFLPFRLPAFWGVVGVGLFVVTVGVIIVWMFVRIYRRDRKLTLAAFTEWVPLPVVVFTLFYLGFLILSQAATSLTSINNRYNSPVYPCFVLFALILVERISASSGWKNPAWARATAVGVVMVWLVYLGALAIERIGISATTGPTEMNIINPTADLYAAWNTSPLLAWLDNHPLEGRLYSNAPAPIYARTELIIYGIPSAIAEWPEIKQERNLSDMDYPDGIPGGVREWAEIEARLSPNSPSYLIWFNDVTRYGCSGLFNFRCYDTLFTIDDLRREFTLTSVVETADGGIYQISLTS